MDVCCECCVLSGRGLCDELITRPEESYRLRCVVVCDLETSWMRRLWPTGGAVAPKERKKERKKFSSLFNVKRGSIPIDERDRCLHFRSSDQVTTLTQIALLHNLHELSFPAVSRTSRTSHSVICNCCIWCRASLNNAYMSLPMWFLWIHHMTCGLWVKQASFACRPHCTSITRTRRHCDNCIELVCFTTETWYVRWHRD